MPVATAAAAFTGGLTVPRAASYRTALACNLFLAEQSLKMIFTTICGKEVRLRTM